MTTGQKTYNKIIMKYCKSIMVGVGEDNTMGEIEITRCKVIETKVYNDTVRTSCEVDIIYRGTLNKWGRKMGPVNQVMRSDDRWLSKWPSKIMRNRAVRSELSRVIMDRLKYFGVFIEYKHMITIKKIVWDI